MTEPVEFTLRIGTFVLVLLVLVLSESQWPLRAAPRGRSRAVRDNLLLFVVSTACVRLLPWSIVALAFLAQQHAFGLFHVLNVRLGVAFIATLVLLDAAVYLQHRLMHRWPWLWRLHRVHHSDHFLDVTSALRFHPGEILLSALYKGGIVVLLGAPPVAVLCFEVVLNASAMFSHSNLALNPRVESKLRALVVTPAMHWIHHSIRPAESRRNFGVCLSVWDRLFGSYQGAPAAGYAAMQLGIAHLEDEAPGVVRLLVQPVREVPTPADGGYVGG